jgi:hypothetical protein
MVPPTSPEAETSGLSSNTQNTAVPATNMATWEVLIQRPALTAPILLISHGATQVASISNTTLNVLR